MKLSLVRSLDAGDPACTLGPALPRPTKEPPLGPPAIVRISPQVISVFGRFETDIPENEEANRVPAVHYDGTVTGRMSSLASAFQEFKKCDFEKIEELDYAKIEARVATSYLEAFELANRPNNLAKRKLAQREAAVGETVRIEDIEDGLVRLPTTNYIWRDCTAGTLTALDKKTFYEMAYGGAPEAAGKQSTGGLGGWLPFTAHEKAGPVAHAKEYLLRCGSPLRAQDVDVFSECGGGTVIGWR